MKKKFKNRRDAGKQLSNLIRHHVISKMPALLILALPRGGVPVAFEIAKTFSAELDIYIVRKIGFPLNPEYAIGALNGEGKIIWDEAALAQFKLMPAELKEIVEAEKAELTRRSEFYRGKKPFPSLNHRNILIVDDGMATGLSMMSVVQALKAYHPSYLAVAVPVSSLEAMQRIQSLVADVICLASPKPFNAVGEWYEDFSQTTDEEVCTLLNFK